MCFIDLTHLDSTVCDSKTKAQVTYTRKRRWAPYLHHANPHHDPNLSKTHHRRRVGRAFADLLEKIKQEYLFCYMAHIIATTNGCYEATS